MGAGPNIRGALVGRNVLFCGDDDPAAIAEAINLVVHQRASSIDAIDQARKVRGDDEDAGGLAGQGEPSLVGGATGAAVMVLVDELLQGAAVQLPDRLEPLDAEQWAGDDQPESIVVAGQVRVAQAVLAGQHRLEVAVGQVPGVVARAF